MPVPAVPAQKWPATGHLIPGMDQSLWGSQGSSAVLSTEAGIPPDLAQQSSHMLAARPWDVGLIQ